jgi:hypothetical protein
MVLVDGDDDERAFYDGACDHMPMLRKRQLG